MQFAVLAVGRRGPYLLSRLAAPRSRRRGALRISCLFLADPDRSGFMTGQTMVIDGGMTRKMIYEE